MSVAPFERPNLDWPNGTLPWTRSCFVCGEENPRGLRLRSRVEEGRVVLDYVTRDSDRGYRHIVHGGIAATLLDEVMTWAAILGMRRVCVAAEFAVRLRAPLEVGRAIRARGWVERVGSRLCLTAGDILDDAGRVMLTATGKYMPMSDGHVSLTQKDFVSSPDALDPERLFHKPTPDGAGSCP